MNNKVENKFKDKLENNIDENFNNIKINKETINDKNNYKKLNDNKIPKVNINRPEKKKISYSIVNTNNSNHSSSNTSFFTNNQLMTVRNNSIQQKIHQSQSVNKFDGSFLRLKKKISELERKLQLQEQS
jgi:hypothetical protein